MIECTDIYSIDELTREFSITARTLYYYEEEGVLVPFRLGDMRFYAPTDHHKLKTDIKC
ncbi:MerR family transcriptional regulator [Bartonella quintana]|uniref:HTH merR-type domain-containing protein n=1 Tax=Bartonella quintana JK 73 TaxID=1402976 RepID=W3TZD1_BARQI|nr:MerR family transcriptional regulator [Bartonella quintana]ETS14221.1 hypothetical protein Q650_00851 [Bartonella quintana JK 73rel]ETS15908.1 hypothetical protein Q649_00860 [Bartonella quintana JK 73]KEC68339.1 hypothetical protein O7Q_00897 [Bartonella quintana JK 39]SQF95629.1 Uncharacterised protein [Bartonella quintana]